MPRTNVPPGPGSAAGARTSASKHSIASDVDETEAEMTSGDAVWTGEAVPWTLADADPGAARHAAASIAPARPVARRPDKRLLTGWGTHDGAPCAPPE